MCARARVFQPCLSSQREGAVCGFSELVTLWCARGEALEQRDDEHRATNFNAIKTPQTRHTWLFGSVPTAVALRGWLD
jgi:hypothetical protein